MKLASLPDASPDGRLVVVSDDLGLALDAAAIAPTLQYAIENWAVCAPGLNRLHARLAAGDTADAVKFDPAAALAPLPRARQWLDASAFLFHSRLMTRAFGMDHDPAEGPAPLMYQGLSDHFLGPCQDVPLPSEADGIDFEGEFAVIVDETPMGVTPAQAAEKIRLILLVNDWSLRALAPREMKTGFGFVQSKPACAMSPMAVTPDALGDAWRDGRIQLPFKVHRSGARFGAPVGGAMAFSFPELIAHAARTRRLCAGTVIGSGTVSNDDAAACGSACISERRALEMIDSGGPPSTPFMAFGERVRMEVLDATGQSIFGAIDQQVVAASAP